MKSPGGIVCAAVVVLTAASVVFLSVAQGAYHLDPHHWGLMTSNAVDIARGRVPYKEIFIQYGFLTAYIEYLFFAAGNNVLSIIFGVSTLYAMGLAGVYFLTFHLAKKRRVALYAFLTTFLIHPLAIYPWPNYIAFPFIVFGCLAIVKGKNNWWICLLGGVLLGLAVLAREGLFLGLALALVALLPIRLWSSQGGMSAMKLLSPLVGFVLPLGLFVFYLWLNELTYYWWQVAIGLPKLYATIFLVHGPVAAIWDLLKYVFQFSLSEHARQTFFALVSISASVYWIEAMFARWKKPVDADCLFIALITVLLLSSSVHLNEIFRLATSVSLGAGLVYILADRLRLAGLLFACATLALVVGVLGRDSGDYFLPSRAQIEAATTSDRIALFARQRWSQDVFDYYDWYVDAMGVLQTRSCGLSYLRNETRDAFLEALSPFVQYQLMPFGNGMLDVPVDEWSQRLRPDYDYGERLKARDILVITTEKPRAGDDAAPDGDRVFNPFIPPQQAASEGTAPDGYRTFARRITPKSWFLPDGLVTLIFAPAECGEMFPQKEASSP
ncbi:hypothetical protein IB244_18475 [Rhizobium sp. RHZ02]|uniref:hypothetical protein n=1 Tax=Rhizobium sp. RHZ02 TaxID=2769306 RepID=UPI001784625D|nr:hypothetical protein [Rhizobium sp. RHZ02]MBD9453530.1 hypothetical protein [Rhizobium sp. RHZ02]